MMSIKNFSSSLSQHAKWQTKTSIRDHFCSSVHCLGTHIVQTLQTWRLSFTAAYAPHWLTSNFYPWDPGLWLVSVTHRWFRLRSILSPTYHSHLSGLSSIFLSSHMKQNCPHKKHKNMCEFQHPAHLLPIKKHTTDLLSPWYKLKVVQSCFLLSDYSHTEPPVCWQHIT